MKSQPVSLWEVLTEHHGRPEKVFGNTFTDKRQAEAFAAHMRGAGYAAEVSPLFEADTFASACARAADFHQDQSLAPPDAGKNRTQ